MEALTTKTGIIYLAVRTDVARTKVGSIERLIEKGFISFAAVGTTIETRHVHQTWAQAEDIQTRGRIRHLPLRHSSRLR